jgi:hypothetical protein
MALKRQSATRPVAEVKPASSRVFKTPGFTDDAEKAGITDQELCKAARALDLGQGDNLGGGVWKKWLRLNNYRSIVLHKVGTWWVFQYLFAKNVEDNIPLKDLKGYKKISKDLAVAPMSAFDDLVADGELVEICKNGKS